MVERKGFSMTKRGKLQAVSLGSGVVLVLTDLNDVGKVDRVHHWQIGAFLILLGLSEDHNIKHNILMVFSHESHVIRL